MKAPILALAIGFLASLFLAAPSLAQVFDAESFTLANGLEVVVVPNHRVPVVSHMIWYKVGAADEVPGKTGLAHMVEHMMFKGTKTVAPGMFSRIVASNGGRDEAFTTADYTVFYQDIAVDRLPEVMRLEADRMQNLALHDKDFQPEHQVVLEELRMRVENSPAGKLDEQMEAALYLNSPYHHPVIGWRSEVEHLTLDDVVAFQKRWYAPNNAILVISGDITAAQARPLVEKYFGPLKARPIPARDRTEEPPPIAARTVELHDPNVHQPEWSRMYLAPSYHAGDSAKAYALQVLAQTLAGDSTGRLYRHLVVEQKLAAEAWAGYDPASVGLTSFDFAVSPNPGVDIDKAAAAMQAEIRDVAEKGVTAQEVEDAKRRMRAGIVYARDSYVTGARVLGRALATGETIADVQAWPDRINAVTVEQVKDAAKAILRDQRSVTGLLLPARPGEFAPGEVPAAAPSLNREIR